MREKEGKSFEFGNLLLSFISIFLTYLHSHQVVDCVAIGTKK